MNWYEKEVKFEDHKLSHSQVNRLLEMTALLCDDLQVMQTVVEMKQLIRNDDPAWEDFWSDLSEEEQNTLWVAPTYGGIFTTKERKIIHKMPY